MKKLKIGMIVMTVVACILCVGLVYSYSRMKESEKEAGRLSDSMNEACKKLDSYELMIRDLNETLVSSRTEDEKIEEYRRDSVDFARTINELRSELLYNRLRIEQIREYVNIVDRKPSQITFLKGWIKRVIEEK